LRKFIALAVSAALAVSLSGCAAANPADKVFEGVVPACEAFTTGENADQIQVDTDMSKVPNVTFPTPITSEVIETKVIVEGKGPKFTGNELVDMEFVGLNGGTGEVFQASKFDGTDFASQYLQAGETPDFCSALSGVRQGSRVAILFPAALGHGGQGVPDLGVGANDSIIFVFDLLKVFLPRATGEAQASAGEGFPALVLDPKTGQPGITPSKSAAPTEFKLHTTIKGRGEPVKLGEVVTVHYTGYVWETGEVFDSSWESGKPTQFQLAEGQLIKGFIKAIEGQTVGSQVITVLPPSEGYGDAAQGSIPANSTLIFVIDILGTNG
jgi:FKBP-type peptidyl-prolyl cis-trans isomerase